MKHAKRMLVVLLMALLCAVLALAVSAEGATIVDSGYCGGEGDGTNLSWTLDSEGTLTISGEGTMKTYCFSERDDITSVVIGNGVTAISDGAFLRCRSLSTVEIGNSVERIENEAFAECVSLTSMNIPDSVKWIGNSCFGECYNLKDISLGNNLIALGAEAFLGCGIKTIELPATLKYINSFANTFDEIESYANTDHFWVFRECFALSSITVAGNNPYYTSIDGCLYSKDRSVLIKYPEAKKGDTYSIPAQVNTINAFAFYGNNYLKELVVPKTVNTIYENAFLGCINLKKVYILNPECAFLFSENYGGMPGVVSIYSTTIYGYEGSTAETLSLYNDCRFEAITDSNLPGSSSTSEPTTQPTTKPTTQPPAETNDQTQEDEPKETLNFFQRIIQWFKNLFAKLFGKK